MPNPSHANSTAPWRPQDAKAQFSALVDNAMRGVPQHVTRSGKAAVVVLSEIDFEALQSSAANRAQTSLNFVDHLLSIPKFAAGEASDVSDTPQLNVQPRDVDFA